jgi:hypothetical protein
MLRIRTADDRAHCFEEGRMLGRLLLIAVQLVVGWYASVELMKLVPSFDHFDIFVMAAAASVLIWLVGVIAGAAIKDLAEPGPPTLMFAFAVSVMFAAIAMLPDVHHAVASVLGPIDLRLYPVVGAVIGYAIQS